MRCGTIIAVEYEWEMLTVKTATDKRRAGYRITENANGGDVNPRRLRGRREGRGYQERIFAARVFTAIIPDTVPAITAATKSTTLKSAFLKPSAAARTNTVSRK